MSLKAEWFSAFLLYARGREFSPAQLLLFAMKTLKLFSSFTLGTVLAASAGAITLSDVDVDGGEGGPSYLYMSTWGVDSWDETFDLLGAGFDPTTMRILSATVSFAFADDWTKSNGKYDKHDWKDNKNDRLEKVDISLGGSMLWSALEVDGSHSNSPSSYDWYSKTVAANILNDLQDGSVSYSVQADYGDFYLKEASLMAEVERINVPDTGATLGMLGIGVATLVILRRQMLKGKDA